VSAIHFPVRPSWRCAACSEPWPCEPKRRELLAEYDQARAALGIAMAGWFSDALVDLHHEPSGQVYLRFLGWVRRPSV
jgi:hypothetical protein